MFDRVGVRDALKERIERGCPLGISTSVGQENDVSRLICMVFKHVRTIDGRAVKANGLACTIASGAIEGEPIERRVRS